MPDTHTEAEYNYSRFTMTQSSVDFDGPKAGEQMPSWEGVDVQGNALTSASVKGKFVVVETGSYTCPMYASGIDEMTNLTEEYKNRCFKDLDFNPI